MKSFNGKLRDECLNQEIFFSVKEAQIVIEQWRNQPPTLIHRISAAGAANIHRQAAKPRSACTHPVVSLRLVQNIRQVISETFVPMTDWNGEDQGWVWRDHPPKLKVQAQMNDGFTLTTALMVTALLTK